MPHSRLMGIEPGQQAGARRRAAWGAVELGEADTARGQRVEIGRWNLATVGSDVRPAHIVHEDDDDVGAGIDLCGNPRCPEGACYRDGRDSCDEDSQQQQRSSASDRHRTPGMKSAFTPPALFERWLPVRERAVWPPVSNPRRTFRHRLDEGELLFVDAHA